MDTHRRSSAAAAAGGSPGSALGASESSATIYSGLELARLAAAGQQAEASSDERHTVYPKLLGELWWRFWVGRGILETFFCQIKILARNGRANCAG